MMIWKLGGAERPGMNQNGCIVDNLDLVDW